MRGYPKVPTPPLAKVPTPPASQVRMGGGGTPRYLPPSPGQGTYRPTPTPRPRTSYMAGGMPLAFTQEDFLVILGVRCEFCGSSEDEIEDKLKRCNNCKEVYYCSRECQKKDWKKGHRDTCEDRFETSDPFSFLWTSQIYFYLYSTIFYFLVFVHRCSVYGWIYWNGSFRNARRTKFGYQHQFQSYYRQSHILQTWAVGIEGSEGTWK